MPRFSSVSPSRLPSPAAPEWGALGWTVLALIAGITAIAGFLLNAEHAAGCFLRIALRLQCHPAILLHGVITTACLIFGFYASARAIGVAIPPEGWATLIPLVLCAMLLPLSIGGWGWREGAAAALFPLIGAPASAGVATGITYGVVLLIAALPAGLILMARSSSENPSSKERLDLS